MISMTTTDMTPASPMKLIFWHLVMAVSAPLLSRAGPADVAFSQSGQSVEAYDFVEVTLNVSKPDAGNPFTDVTVQGHFEKTSGADKLSVTGFCDASDGSVFRIRFMPASEGDYTYTITYSQGAFERMETGKFRVTTGRRRGPMRVDRLDITTHKAQPTAGSEDERRYIRYAAARLSAFSNITWDLGDDLDSFRDEKWAHETGTLLVGWDPYKHLATSHPTHREPQDRASDWFGFTSIQDWSRNQHALMLEERQIQKKTGRIIPQVQRIYGRKNSTAAGQGSSLDFVQDAGLAGLGAALNQATITTTDSRPCGFRMGGRRGRQDCPNLLPKRANCIAL